MTSVVTANHKVPGATHPPTSTSWMTSAWPSSKPASSQAQELPLFLYGHSMGGLEVLYYGLQNAMV